MDAVDFFAEGDVLAAVFDVDFFGAVFPALAVDLVAVFGAALAVDRVVDFVAVLAVDFDAALVPDLAGALAVDFAGALLAVRVVDFAAVLAGAFAADRVVLLAAVFVAVFGAALVVDPVERVDVVDAVARLVDDARVPADFFVVAGAFFADVARVAAGFDPAREVVPPAFVAVADVDRVVLAVDARLAGALGSLR